MVGRSDRFAFVLLLFGNVALAFGPWLVRLSDVGPVATGFWRLAIALPFLWVAARIVGQPAHWPRRAVAATIAVAALFYALDLAAWNAGIRMTKLGNSTLFGNAGSFVFAAYGLWLAHRAPSRREFLALALAFGGAALLMGSSYDLSHAHFTGDLLTLAAGLLYGGYLIFVEKARSRLGAMPVLFLATVFSLGPLLAISVALGERIWPSDWTPLVTLALTSQLIGQGVLVWAIGRLAPLVVGLALLTQPVVSAAIGWIVYGEALSAFDITGAVAVAVALVLVRLPRRGLHRSEPSAS